MNNHKTSIARKILTKCIYTIVKPIIWLNMKYLLNVLYRIDSEILADANKAGLIEKHGFYLLKNHFYNPIPDTLDLRTNTIFDRQTSLPGIDKNLTEQLRYLKQVFPNYRQYYEQLPEEPVAERLFFHKNGNFGYIDAQLLVCMLLHFKPRRIIEVGSGYSTVLMAETLSNKNADLTCIEPYPIDVIKKIDNKITLIPKRVQDLSTDIFNELQENDILFIDSSHTVKIGGDVNYLFLEILPRLKPGVLVHIHDIFLPWEYPKEWIFNLKRYWAEQHLLQAFLIFNNRFEIIFSKSMMNEYYPQELLTTFPAISSNSKNIYFMSSSFWLKRTQAI